MAMAEAKGGIRTKVASETKDMLILSAYLAVLFCTFRTYRALVSAEYHLNYFHYGISLFEALVLAKVILIGRFLRIGERFGDRPLIVPTIYKTLTFGLFVLAFAVLEDVIDGLWHRESAHAIIRKIVVVGPWEILARVVIVLTALVPLFAAEEIGRVLGEKKLFELFFKRRSETAAAPQ
jgi:hypothetical protein